MTESGEPKTFPELLDAAQTGEEFARVLGNLLDVLRKAVDDE